MTYMMDMWNSDPVNDHEVLNISDEMKYLGLYSQLRYEKSHPHCIEPSVT